jgi:hypothetical protein
MPERRTQRMYPAKVLLPLDYAGNVIQDPEEMPAQMRAFGGRDSPLFEETPSPLTEYAERAGRRIKTPPDSLGEGLLQTPDVLLGLVALALGQLDRRKRPMRMKRK